MRSKPAELTSREWRQPDSNQRPSACKADALNQLSYASITNNPKERNSNQRPSRPKRDALPSCAEEFFDGAEALGQALYEIAFIAVKGQTPGKMLLKVRVVRETDGQIPGWGPATMRWVPTLVGLVPCVGSFLSLGLWIWALVNLFSHPKRQTPFDLAAKTVVITAG